MEAAWGRPLGIIYVYFGVGTGVRKQGLAGGPALAPTLRTEGRESQGNLGFGDMLLNCLAVQAI